MHKFALAFSLCSTVALFAADTPQERLSDATKVFTEIMETPDKGIPQDLIEKANCIVIVPGLKTAGFIVGGKFGKGYLSCRAKSGAGTVNGIRADFDARSDLSPMRNEP